MITGSMITGIYCAKMVTTVFLLLAVTGTSMQKFYGYKKGKRQYSDVASTFGKSLLVHFFFRRQNQGNTKIPFFSKRVFFVWDWLRCIPSLAATPIEDDAEKKEHNW